ncbi:hypothetical protein [Natronorubrum sp. A-ect3]|uniref:hypothetical protein n=1 Tax=Natronorubrum sp. A-ect3 TaxID=3242698 RepID=UPI00359D3F4B
MDGGLEGPVKSFPLPGANTGDATVLDRLHETETNHSTLIGPRGPHAVEHAVSMDDDRRYSTVTQRWTGVRLSGLEESLTL